MKDQAQQSYGKRLQEARLNAGLSPESVAESLRLDLKFVVALEREDTEVLPAPTYTRGYIRAYAQLVRCNAEELIAQYNLYAEDDPELTDVTAVEKPDSSSGPLIFWVTSGIVGALVVLLALWVYDGLRSGDLRVVSQPAEQAEQPQPSFESPAAPGETPTFAPGGLSGLTDSASQEVRDPVLEVQQQSDVPDNMLSEAEMDPGVEQQRQDTSDVASEISDEVTFTDEVETTASESRNEVIPAAPSGSDVLRLHFKGESWAEVVDANGFRQAYGLFRGRTLNFEGQAPFRVMLGDATQVDVMINGTVVVLKPYIRWNKTAHLSVGEAANSSD